MKTNRILSAFLFISFIILIISACQQKGVKPDAPILDVQELTKNQPETHGKEIKEGDLIFNQKLDPNLGAKGKITYDVKCKSCHKLSDEKLVGPGWAGVTKKRTSTWIMNMITNVDMMLEKDPEAQKLLEQCLVRMPNQNISTLEAMELVEFMRQNDGEK